MSATDPFNTELPQLSSDAGELPETLRNIKSVLVELRDRLEAAEETLAANVGANVGMMVPFGTATARTGYLYCDGAEVSRETYADLFAVIGVAFGAGNGITTFNLPDMRGRTARGWTDGSGRDWQIERLLGSYQEDSLQDFSGSFRIRPNENNGSAGLEVITEPTGPFDFVNTGQAIPGGHSIDLTNVTGTTWRRVDMDISTVARVNQYETTTKNCAVAWHIKY